MSALPQFSTIDVEKIIPELNEILERNRAHLASVLASKPQRWATLIDPLEKSENELHKWWSRISHLHSVKDSPALREAYNAALPLLTEYSTEIEQNEDLYQAYCAVRDHDESLSSAQRHIVTEAIRDFELSGIALPADKKKVYADIQQRLSDLGAKFEQNLLDATMAWYLHYPDSKPLQGLPPTALENAQAAAKAHQLEGYVITLDGPSFIAVMTYADDRNLREQVYRAYVTRASEQQADHPEWDNTGIINETLQWRQRLAELLGFPHFAALSLASKMAPDVETVEAFLLDLANKAKPQAENELQEVRDFAAKQFNVKDLEAWDIAYYSEKLRQANYQLSDEDVRPYFPESKVLDGLFAISEKLFGIRFAEHNDVDRWHDSVRFFDVQDESGQVLAHFYVDLHARRHKRGGAWMDDAQGRLKIATGERQKPIAFLTCNFSGPTDSRPALFTHDDVVTLFHEFGHGLHHMLSEVDHLAATGIHGVEWDAVELPSQFMENFCWDPEALKKLSGHYKTGEPLPDDLIEKMLAAKHFQSAMQMVRQLEFSLFDLRLHAQALPVKPAGTMPAFMDVLNAVRAEVSVIKPPAFNRFAHGFSHIFAGGYAAGYYSYKWAEVLSADAFSRFEEDGLFNENTGRAFRKEILAVGGSRPAMQSFIAFRGREPETEPLLRHNGIEVAAA
ncbi:M3 family metallopeptidase [Permianibacter aggregans]|uniref:oligopeptidase A n=1 Tax=Permianibacter aggregans TaxID=1510150 RepID=A0A4R6UUW0_9GAMM|nr:M3 family metallopeptidase [Permianibacter aggregans]QGX40003.1 M3 family peptidase [Permianibacter aggregans]TDQ49185.1 oligopeptidase A [Permianibacter aggregans]